MPRQTRSTRLQRLAPGRDLSPQGRRRIVFRFAPDIEAGMAGDQAHVGIAKTLISPALVDLHHRHAIVEEPAQHRIGAIVGRGDPGRAGLLQLGLGPADDRLVTGLAADRIGAADEIEGHHQIVEADGNDKGDAGDDRDFGPAERHRDKGGRPSFPRQHRQD